MNKIIYTLALTCSFTTYGMDNPTANQQQGGWFSFTGVRAAAESISGASTNVRELIATIQQLKNEIAETPATPEGQTPTLELLRSLIADIERTTPQAQHTLNTLKELLTNDPHAPTLEQQLNRINATLDKATTTLNAINNIQTNTTRLTPQLSICGIGFLISCYGLHHLYRALEKSLDAESSQNNDQLEQPDTTTDKKNKSSKRSIAFNCVGIVSGILIILSSRSI